MTENSIPWDAIRVDVLADPAVKGEYDALETEFSIVNQVIALRAATGLTQREFAERVGMKQSQLARIESGKQIPKLEALAKLADAAGYIVEVHFMSAKGKQNREIKPLRINLSNVDDATPQSISIRELLTEFLGSDDPVAVKVQEKLGGRSPLEFAAELEKCLSIPDVEERPYAVKNLLAGSVTPGGTYRDSSDDNEAIELLDIAEELLEKLAEIWGNAA